MPKKSNKTKSKEEVYKVKPEEPIIEREVAIIQPEVASIEPEVACVEPEVASVEPEEPAIKPLVKPEIKLNIEELIKESKLEKEPLLPRGINTNNSQQINKRGATMGMYLR